MLFVQTNFPEELKYEGMANFYHRRGYKMFVA